jgi:hypothetical protein
MNNINTCRMHAAICCLRIYVIGTNPPWPARALLPTRQFNVHAQPNSLVTATRPFESNSGSFAFNRQKLEAVLAFFFEAGSS